MFWVFQTNLQIFHIFRQSAHSFSKVLGCSHHTSFLNASGPFASLPSAGAFHTWLGRRKCFVLPDLGDIRLAGGQWFYHFIRLSLFVSFCAVLCDQNTPRTTPWLCLMMAEACTHQNVHHLRCLASLFHTLP